MAVKITGFARAGSSAGSPPVPDAASVTEGQSVTIGGGASNAFILGTSIVEIDSDTACRVEFGTAPDGLGHTFLIPASTPRQFGVKAGYKVIAVAA